MLAVILKFPYLFYYGVLTMKQFNRQAGELQCFAKNTVHAHGDFKHQNNFILGSQWYNLKNQFISPMKKHVNTA